METKNLVAYVQKASTPSQCPSHTNVRIMVLLRIKNKYRVLYIDYNRYRTGILTTVPHCVRKWLICRNIFNTAITYLFTVIFYSNASLLIFLSNRCYLNYHVCMDPTATAWSQNEKQASMNSDKTIMRIKCKTDGKWNTSDQQWTNSRGPML